jgi:predicted nicotinamide N-methyase
LRVWQACEIAPIWEMTEAALEAQGVAPPFWAFPWVGGQVLARYLLDHPHVAAGRRVLSFACGGGLEALAAARAGAAEVRANDIDPVALIAAQLNAEANGLALIPAPGDLLGASGRALGPCDLILAGDVFYEKAEADRIAAWLRARAGEGACVLIGDAGRGMLPGGLRRLAVHEVPTPRALEDRDSREGSVWRLTPS